MIVECFSRPLVLVISSGLEKQKFLLYKTAELGYNIIR